MLRLLILGGTSEGSALARALAGRTDITPLLSLAGRTEHPVVPPIAHRIGGFGGLDGLAHFIAHEGIDAVLDATHPFAARISANAVAACSGTGTPLATFTRPPWQPEAGDRWTAAPDIEAAAAMLGATPLRVFLTTGRLDLARFKRAPQHHYLIRTIDPPTPAELPPGHTLLLARGPFTAADEESMLRSHPIDVLVTKNSGAAASAAKLAAARHLDVPVIMVDRPPAAGGITFFTLDETLAWIAAQRERP